MKTTAIVAAALAMLGLFAPGTARAQEINLSSLDQEPNRVHLATGADYGFVATAGYSRVARFVDRHVVLTTEVTLPWAQLDLSDFRVSAGALVPIVGTSRWQLAASLAPVVRGTSNSINRMLDVGLDVGVVGGFYSRAWFVGLEADVDLALTTHVTHRDAYRMNVHPDARDGWYGNPGANLRGGVTAGVTVARYDLTVRAGQVRDVAGEVPLFPWYGEIALGARW